MATEIQNRRRKSLLAILLALIAAGALCVIAAAAAGYTVSSPLLDAFIAIFAGDRAATGGEDRGAMIPPTGGEAGWADGDEAAAAEEQNCLLGFLCLNASAAGSVDGTDRFAAGAATTSGQRCFLNLICLTANTSTSGLVGSNNDANVKVDGEGIDANVDSDSNDGNCFLGLICFNASANAGADASLANSLSSWLESFMSFFIRVEVNG